jgi:hypothetical protein
MGGNLAHRDDGLPLSRRSMSRFERSGWSTGLTSFAGPSGLTVRQVHVHNREIQLRVEGSTQSEAWHRAVEAAALCGTLADWPRPEAGRGDR